MSVDWIVDGRRVGEIWANGGHWLHDRGDFPLVAARPLPGETEVRHLDIARISFPGRPDGALVFRGPVIRDQVVGCEPLP